MAIKISEVPKEYFVDVNRNTLILMLYYLAMFIIYKCAYKMEDISLKFQKTYNRIRYVLGIEERNFYRYLCKLKRQLDGTTPYSEALNAIQEINDSRIPEVYETGLDVFNRITLICAFFLDEKFFPIYERDLSLNVLLRNFPEKEFVSKIKPKFVATNIVNLCEKFSNIYSNILFFNADNLVMLRQNLNKDPPFY